MSSTAAPELSSSEAQSFFSAETVRTSEITEILVLVFWRPIAYRGLGTTKPRVFLLFRHMFENDKRQVFLYRSSKVIHHCCNYVLNIALKKNIYMLTPSAVSAAN